MMRLGKVSGRKWVVVGLVLGTVGTVGAIFAGSGRDPWPPRLVIPLPRDCWPQGFTLDGRSYWVASWAANESEMIAWDLATGERLPPPKEPMIWPLTDPSVGRGYVGAMMAAKPNEREVVWVDRASGAVRARFPVGAGLSTHTRLVDGGRSIRTWLARTDGSGRWRIKQVVTWDIANGTETRRPFLGPGGANFEPLASSSDGRLLYAYLDKSQGTIQVWDLEADRPLGKPFPAPRVLPSPQPSAAFTPDGRTLIVGRDDGRAEFWDVAESRLVRTLKVHPSDYVFGLISPSPDGRSLTSTGYFSSKSSLVNWLGRRLDRISPGWTARVLNEAVVVDLATGQVLARSSGSIDSRFSPDGRTIVTREWDWTLTIRDVPQSSDKPRQ